MRVRSRMFVCAWLASLLLAVGCGDEIPACGTPLPSPVVAELVQLTSEPSRATLQSSYDSVRRIEHLLKSHGDRRATFALFYRHILVDAIPALQTSMFEHDAWAEEVSLYFVQEFLSQFHNKLTGAPVRESWERFHQLSADCSRTPSRIVLSALMAHLIVDFPLAIDRAKSTSEQWDDFYEIGELLTSTTYAITDDFKVQYGMDLRPFFELAFLGRAVNGIDPDAISSVLFQTVRTVAWGNGLALDDSWIGSTVRASLDLEWEISDAALDYLEELGAI